MRKGVKIYLVLPFLKVNVEQNFGSTFLKSGKSGFKNLDSLLHLLKHLPPYFPIHLPIL